MTNAEYLRNLSDKKLAAWLWNYIDSDIFCREMCPARNNHDCSKSTYDCAAGMMEWLQQERKGAE